MSDKRLERALAPFREAAARPYDTVKACKASGRTQVVGCSPMHFPEELIHAAGMLPVVLQETEEPVTEGFAHVHPFFCGITRNAIDLAARGGLDFFDGLIYSDICIQNRNAALSLKHILPKGVRMALAQFPTVLSRDGVFEDTLRELGKVRGFIENLAGRRIEDQALAESIRLFNRNRGLLRRLFDLCRESPGRLSMRDRQIVVRAGMVMPREEYGRLLAGLATELEAVEPMTRSGQPLFLSGHLCQGPKLDIVDLIEGTGVEIVDDDLYTGRRYFALDAETDGPPLEALARRILDRTVPVPTRSDGEMGWAGYLVDRIRQSGARGAILLIAKYCEPHLFVYPFMKAALAEAGIPYLMLETEHEVVSLEGMRTRLQAFVEMLDRKAI
ncbi:MAG: 2-hydroxyacyl-CoA dehydratase family protein [Proteobacteria bacterium]|nr:2-hydroxyacyl-CoA dehydratase family protein [Pseudomonadota bacterium]